MSSIVLEAGPNLRIIFDRRADRWGHRIELLDDGAMMAAIESVEGSAIDNWPPSPAFQTLDVETRAGERQIALLVGKAGESHWSAAVEADGAAEVIAFDVACRFTTDPEFLGSRYSVIGGSATWPRGVPCFVISAIDEGVRRVVQTDERQRTMTIQVNDQNASLPRTVRWKYTLSLPKRR